MTKKFSISVVVPLYNKEETIERCVRSVLRQRLRDFELIIIDDASTDNSLHKVRNFDDSRIRLYTKENGGAASARNLGILKSKFDYVAFLDADDEWEDNHLEIVYALYRAAPHAVLFGTAYQRVSNGKILNRVQYKGMLPDSPIIWHYIEAFLKTMPLSNSSSTVVKKNILFEIGGFPTVPRFFEDWNVWLKAAMLGATAYSPVVTVSIHLDASNRSQTEYSPEKKIFSIEYLDSDLRSFMGERKSDEVSHRKIIKKIYLDYIKKSIISKNWNALDLMSTDAVSQHIKFPFQILYLTKFNRILSFLYFWGLRLVKPLQRGLMKSWRLT